MSILKATEVQILPRIISKQRDRKLESKSILRLRKGQWPVVGSETLLTIDD